MVCFEAYSSHLNERRKDDACKVLHSEHSSLSKNCNSEQYYEEINEVYQTLE
jgi:hypothetical protein